VGVTDQANSYG